MCALSSRNTQFVPAASPFSSPLLRRKYTYANAAKKKSPSMHPAKQIRFSRNRRRSSFVFSSFRSWIESIHFRQKRALRWIDGMLSIAANAFARSVGSGTYVSSSVR